MRRRNILFGAAALTVGGGFTASGAKAAPGNISINSYVCNLGNHCSEAEILAISSGAKLAFAAEENRNFDPGSVAVYYNGRRIGYLPRATGQNIAAQLAAGLEVQGQAIQSQILPRPRLDIVLNTLTGS